jgi:short-subunit dehydrogenase
VTVRPPLDGGTALITGASSGIGREFAVQLAARAGTLVLAARRAGLLEGLRAELMAAHPRLQVVALPVDLSNEHDVDRCVCALREQVDGVDVLINNAGLGDQALFDATDWTRTRQILHTNVVAVVQLTALLVPPMVERGRGGVLNVGSGAGQTVMPGAAVYSASKHFIDGFSEALRADLAGTGVVVTQVCPGPVDSDFDTVAGSAGGMTGGPPQFLRISAARCAREALAGFDAGQPLVFPGRAYRIAMRALPLLPRSLQRHQAASTAARLRSQASPAATGPGSAHPGIPESETPA